MASKGSISWLMERKGGVRAVGPILPLIFSLPLIRSCVSRLMRLGSLLQPLHACDVHHETTTFPLLLHHQSLKSPHAITSSHPLSPDQPSHHPSHHIPPLPVPAHSRKKISAGALPNQRGWRLRSVEWWPLVRGGGGMRWIVGCWRGMLDGGCMRTCNIKYSNRMISDGGRER